MTRHTPGPWVVDWQGPDQPIYSGNVCVATAWAGAGSGPDDETKDNAQLIAAAPDLLAAAETVLRYLEDGTPTDERSDAENSAIIQLVQAIRAAGGTLPSEYTRTLGGAL